MAFEKTTGFASLAQGYEDCSIDLNELLVKNAPATYYYYRLDSTDMTALELGVPDTEKW
jgi:hypothetical protein